MNHKLIFFLVILLFTSTITVQADNPVKVLYSESLSISSYEYSISYSRLGVPVTGVTPFGVSNGSYVKLEIINSIAGLEYGSVVEGVDYRFTVDTVETSVLVDLYELVEFNLTLNIFETLILPSIAEFENGSQVDLFEYSNQTGYAVYHTSLLSLAGSLNGPDFLISLNFQGLSVSGVWDANTGIMKQWNFTFGDDSGSFSLITDLSSSESGSNQEQSSSTSESQLKEDNSNQNDSNQPSSMLLVFGMACLIIIHKHRKN